MIKKERKADEWILTKILEFGCIDDKVFLLSLGEFRGFSIVLIFVFFTNNFPTTGRHNAAILCVFFPRLNEKTELRRRQTIRMTILVGCAFFRLFLAELISNIK